MVLTTNFLNLYSQSTSFFYFFEGEYFFQGEYFLREYFLQGSNILREY